MRKLLIVSSFILVLSLLLICTAGLVLAREHPLPSYSLLFPLQDFAENEVLKANSVPARRAEYTLELLEKRIEDLQQAAGTEKELVALDSLDQAIAQTLQTVSDLPDDGGVEARSRLAALAETVLKTLPALSVLQEMTPERFATFSAKVETLHRVVTGKAFPGEEVGFLAERSFDDLGGEASPTATAQNAIAESGPARVSPHRVPFPPGSPGAVHAFFPLSGEHSTIDCSACHTGFQYTGAPTACFACHREVEPAVHYLIECSLCHTPVSWTEVSYSHDSVSSSDCKSCHERTAPADHYQGQCSSCHNTSAWRPASFDHAAAGATDCASCHSDAKPPDHFQGQCSACHSTEAWVPAYFNHAAAGATDCLGCHLGAASVNHYQGQCSVCHTTEAWIPADFNHSAAGASDCISCHIAQRPPDHFEGQCSACHATEHWLPASFDHSQASNDCVSCHLPDKPAGHYNGQCSSCHSPDHWQPANFDHTAAGATDCAGCHLDDRPTPHFEGQCSLCHNTGNWGNVDFDHSFPMDHGDTDGNCAQCHPSNTPAWQCESCHSMGEMLEEHEDIPDIAGRCIECHPDGED
ncbi:MAG TPA: cytochrome c3 family protein [Anaerolineales bacterium]|nr:cytochrome c3 family protein [Anaerolineales bacterium]